MLDFLGNELNVGDFVITKTPGQGSKMFQTGIILRMTKYKVYLFLGITYQNILKIECRDHQSIVKIENPKQSDIDLVKNNAKAFIDQYNTMEVYKNDIALIKHVFNWE